ncbi:hypothetical protein [Ruminococcus albus]|uniref:Uncharacterized protein n=1 Tax=Ruminococcus albus (strain ATCC 27210 / DSM 20455 / JCM 14654 / NCDO 2250 / 7) TaxID=697329 RepID=E6UJY0_RUMA7|nr:hypothetical protein [Ruminococcus albus]ADU23976.1 hypothetical protein Rumal_3534 [Ruminococcus albus 7 = DSM 20455]
MDNFKIPSDTLDRLNDFADQIMDMIDGSYPFFIVYATENMNKKTNYKYFYSIPSELGYKLCDNKMKDILDLHNIPRDGTPCSVKDFSMPDDEREKLRNIVNSFMFYCQNARIPCFIQIAVENNAEKNSTEYIMDIVSPYRLLIKLNNDKITKVLRYTMESNIYPSRLMDLKTDLLDISEMVNDVTKLDHDQEEIYPDSTETEFSEIYSAPVYNPETAEYDVISEIVMDSAEIIESMNNKETKAISDNKITPVSEPVEEKPKKKRGRKKKSETVLTSDVPNVSTIEKKEEPDELPKPKKRGRKKKSETVPVPEETSVINVEHKEIPDEAPKPKKRGRKKKTEMNAVIETPAATSAPQKKIKTKEYSNLGEIITPIMKSSKSKKRSNSALYEKYKDILERFPDDFIDGEYDDA